MKEQLIEFETAELAKSKGFGLGENDYILLPTVYELDGSLYNAGKLTGNIGRKYTGSPNHLGADTIDDFKACVFLIDNSLDEYILAPTQSLLQKWLREVHNIEFIPPLKFGQDEYACQIVRTDKKKTFKTYEEALEIGLQEALNLI